MITNYFALSIGTKLEKYMTLRKQLGNLINNTTDKELIDRILPVLNKHYEFVDKGLINYGKGNLPFNFYEKAIESCYLELLFLIYDNNLNTQGEKET